MLMEDVCWVTCGCQGALKSVHTVQIYRFCAPKATWLGSPLVTGQWPGKVCIARDGVVALACQSWPLGLHPTPRLPGSALVPRSGTWQCLDSFKDLGARALHQLPPHPLPAPQWLPLWRHQTRLSEQGTLLSSCCSFKCT
jgi:hypothetical protein